MNDLNILFTSVGRRSYLIKFFKEALAGRGLIHVANSSDISPAFLVADKSIVTPLIYDENYVPFLLDYCKNNRIKMIISLFDVDLPILSINKDKFLQIGTKVIVSDIDVLNICNDKWNTYNFLKVNKLRAPMTYVSLEAAKRDINEGIISFPLYIKPRWGMGSIAVYEAENNEELEILYHKVLRNINKTYLKYESKEDINACVLIQEKVTGQEYGLDIINDLNGNYQTTIVKMKCAMRSGETDCAIIADKPELKKLGEIISNKLNHIGNLDCDVFLDGDNITILEMNARFGGGYPFSHLAGVNLPLAIIEWELGLSVDDSLLLEEIGVLGQKDIEIVRLR